LTLDRPLPFGDNTVDKITMENTFGILSKEEREATVKEIGRTIKPGGTVVLLDGDAPETLARQLEIVEGIRTAGKEVTYTTALKDLGGGVMARVTTVTVGKARGC
jgi:ubiquinone/menaquinone biosynthesis C-methylase UbiE